MIDDAKLQQVPQPKAQPKPQLLDLDNELMVEILRHLDMWDLANVAMTSEAMKRHADAAFLRGSGHIEFDDTRSPSDLLRVVKKFRHLVGSIWLRNAGNGH